MKEYATAGNATSKGSFMVRSSSGEQCSFTTRGKAIEYRNRLMKNAPIGFGVSITHTDAKQAKLERAIDRHMESRLDHYHRVFNKR
jgi:hypothetical protein